MTSCTGRARGGFWGFWKKSVELSSASGEDSWLSRARQGLVSGAHVVWGRWKSQHRKVYLSPYVKKPFNSKVIKSFVPELRSHKCFSCFGIPMSYVYMLWTFYVCFTYPYHGYGTTCFSCFGIPMFYVYMLWTFYVCFTYPYHGYGTTCFSCFGIPMFYVYMLWTFYVCFTYPYHGYGTKVQVDD